MQHNLIQQPAVVQVLSCVMLLQAAAAAEALRAIFPSVQSTGADMVIPMPGHPPANAKAEAAMQQV
jgi:hypothetical protein